MDPHRCLRVPARAILPAAVIWAKKRGSPDCFQPGNPREIIPAACYSPTGKPRSTLAAETLHCRVRNGNGCCLPAMATGKSCSGRSRKRKHSPGCSVVPPAASAAPPVLRRVSLENGQASRRISTGRLNGSPRFHLRPIEVVVFNLPSGGLRPGRSCLGGGLALRCFQRLSVPHIATQRCRWRDNWNTRGASFPVLSYWGMFSSNLLRPQRIWTELSHDVLNPARVPL